MIVRLGDFDLPRGAHLSEQEDFTSFKVVLEKDAHVYVRPDQLRELAGSSADDAEWIKELDRMVAYAQGKGWVRPDGAIRAHIELGEE